MGRCAYGHSGVARETCGSRAGGGGFQSPGGRIWGLCAESSICTESPAGAESLSAWNNLPARKGSPARARLPAIWHSFSGV